MPRDDSLPSSTTARARAEAGRPRMALVFLGLFGVLILGILIERMVIIRPGNAQMVVVSRGGEVTAVYQPGQIGFLFPFTHTSAVYDMALMAADRSTPDRGMPAVSAEGHPLTVFGTAFWHEGNEDDLRWRFAHIRWKTDPKADMMLPLMAASVQAVMGRHTMDEIIRNSHAITTALTEDLKARARSLLRVDVTDFALTRIEPGDTYRQVVAEREMGRARAAAVAVSPALTTDNPNALELERIRRWDGHGIIPDTLNRSDNRPPSR
ncbi:SPFH domain-containing protein [Roseomonas xinghualingensis]|uniref:SPFH domain-containing protein n=1 Tax=Roseomonas xinghualingensis TaxID=2986475 RepID=UPI0021F16C0A|nr:SPFH domain-containing protein [Roseomonas sp. SXEYE001]MCV4207902.1 SPFH domain-containing protein [Roseomonas sp. SXEYE001]